MVAFIASLLITGVMIGIVVYVGVTRDPATPLTWGEAFVAGTFVLGLMLMLYGVVPDRWLRWADGDLKWRSDKIGIPTGPLAHFDWWFIKIKNHLLWPDGLTFGGRGRIMISAEVVRDIIATVIYGIAMGVNFMGWSWWQKRGQRKAAVPELETSAYGRPLVRGSA
jgi:hypothetical protein